MPIRRPVTTAMIFLTLAVFGWKSYTKLPINLMPDISYPTLTVRTEFEGAAPEDVEKLLTRPLEETLSIVTGMVEISSTSSPGLSEVVLEFTWDTDMGSAQQEVRDQLDLYEPPPEVTQQPIILRYDPTLDPVMRVAITSTRDLSHIAGLAERQREEQDDLTDIRDAAMRHVKSDLEGEEGIAQVEIKGGREEEIQILVDTERLKAIGLPIDAVRAALSSQNINLTGGRLVEGKTEYLVRTINEFREVSEISQVILAIPEGDKTILLGDIAEVIEGEKDQQTIVRINGKEAVELEIFKWGDANTVQVCNKLKDMFGFEREPTLLERVKASLKARMGAGAEPPKNAPLPTQYYTAQLSQELAARDTLLSRLPDNVEITLTSDQSRFIVAAIKEVKNTAIVGGILALLVLYFFLRELKATVIIGVAIPISIIATFIPMFMQGITLNIMSLGGLALGVGMLVDNSIVVLESIFRCTEEGDDTVDAAHRGTKEVASAVTASTLTTICVFLPMAFVEGIAGQLFGDQAMTVTFSLIASLLVALFFIPMIASRKRLALVGTQEVFWMLRAYRVSRSEEGRSVSASIARVPWNAFMEAGDWVYTIANYYYTPTLNALRRLPTVLRIVLAIFPLVLVSFVFAIHLGLKLAQATVVTVGSVLLGVVVGVVWIIGSAMKIVMWLPLTVFDRTFTAFRALYVRTLRQALRFSPVVLAVVAILAVHAAVTATGLGQELIPPLKQGQFGIRLEAPAGTKLAETARRARIIEDLAMAVPEIGTITAEIGQGDSSGGGTRGENVAEFTVLLAEPGTQAAVQDRIIDELRTAILRKVSDDVTFSLPSLFSFKTAVELQIRGDELDEIKKIGLRIVDSIRDIEGLRDVELGMKEGYPEIIIEMDRERLAALGLSPIDVAQRIRQEVGGDDASQFNRPGRKIDIRVLADKQLLESVGDLRSLSVVDGSPPVSLESVANIYVQPGPSEIIRVDQRRVGIITANHEGRDLGSITTELMERASMIPLPKDYQIVAGGQNRELETSLNSLQFALMLAIFLVYVVMASQFESIWHPAIVMFSVPLAFIGVVYALQACAIDLSIVVYIGGIILAGIVVNDAIVLVDYINQLRARGLPKREAVIQAGQVRLRPIIMTTITTVLGLLPMAMWSGEGAEIRQPMAITVMAGLTSATVLTLIIIPMVYDLVGGSDPA